jgi:hypothetical protein
MNPQGSITLDVTINGKSAKAMIDSGATITIISSRWIEKNKIPHEVRRHPIQVRLADDQAPVWGGGMINFQTKRVKLQVLGTREQRQFSILDLGGQDMILGMDWLKRRNPEINWKNQAVRFHEERNEGRQSTRTPTDRVTSHRRRAIQKPHGAAGISQISLSQIMAIYQKQPQSVGMIWVRRVGADTEGDSHMNIPNEYQEYQWLFEENIEEALPDHQDWDHKIPLKEGTKLRPEPLRPLSREQHEELKQYLKTNLKKGYIRDSESQVAFPILFVPKKNGKLRLCVDYRQLNNATIKNRYPLPLITELMQRLQGAKWFTKFDIREGYYRIRIAEGEEWKTAFRTSEGLYEYQVMPFGLTNAPATFQAVINAALHEYLYIFVIAYLDDVLVYTNGSLEEHVEHVKKVLNKLAEKKLLIHPDKSEFHVQETTYLGFIVNTEGIKMDPEKTDEIAKWPVPKTVKEVQSFLGFTNFYRRFIKGYSAMTAPLTEITKKEKGFQWGEKEQKAFEGLKELFTQAPMLAMYDPELEIIVETDASDFAQGICISQKQGDGKIRPIGFHSRKFTPAELNYDVHDKELMAVVTAFEQYEPYLIGAKHQVTVYSDHKNLTGFTTTKKLNRRQVRWAETLAQFDFKILHRKGKENGAADALSRRADYQIKKTIKHDAMLRRTGNGTLEYNHPRLARISAQLKNSWDEKLEISHRNGRKIVSDEIKEEFVKDFHEAAAHGHQGIRRTCERLARNYEISNMRETVEKVVNDCVACGRNKPTRHRPYGFLQPLEPPQGAWEAITMDFITKLPESKEPGTGQKCDAILVIGCRLTKYFHFVPTTEKITAEELAYVVIRTVIANHGTPKEWISDRDKLFTSAFWTTTLAMLGADKRLSTAYHPQTDGQTERTNQSLEQYLRIYINEQQTDWVRWLPMAQYAHNSARNETTGMSPFYANYGYEPSAYGEPRKLESVSAQGEALVNKMKGIQEKLQAQIAQGNERMARQANQTRIEGPIFKRGDRVYLSRKNLTRKNKPSKKLDHKRLGPFEIEEVLGPLNYKLRLPKKMRIHPNFHVSLLEPAPQNAPLDRDAEAEEDREHEVEEIRDLQKFGRQWKYLVHWKGYDHTEDTWEPLKNLRNCQQKVGEFHEKHPEIPKPTRKSQSRTNPPQGERRTRRAAGLKAQPGIPLPSPTIRSGRAPVRKHAFDAQKSVSIELGAAAPLPEGRRPAQPRPRERFELRQVPAGPLKSRSPSCRNHGARAPGYNYLERNGRKERNGKSRWKPDICDPGKNSYYRECPFPGPWNQCDRPDEDDGRSKKEVCANGKHETASLEVCAKDQTACQQRRKGKATEPEEGAGSVNLISQHRRGGKTPKPKNSHEEPPEEQQDELITNAVEPYLNKEARKAFARLRGLSGQRVRDEQLRKGGRMLRPDQRN